MSHTGRTISPSNLFLLPNRLGQIPRGMRDWVLNAAGRLVGKSFLRALHEMEEAQWEGPEQSKARTEQKLSPLLAHAARHVPFYRDYCRKHGIEPEQLRTAEDLRTLPVLNKSDYRERGIEKFFAENVPAHRRLERSTSGSSGDPFCFVIDRQATPIIFASHLFYDSWFGFRPFDRYIRIVSPPAAAPAVPRSAPVYFRYRQALTKKLQTWYETHTQEKISVWNVDGQGAVEIWRRIDAFRPDFILGYTSTLSTIASELLERNLRLLHHPRAVVTIAESLTPLRRQLIEEYFGTPVVDRYGLREFGSWSAQSCPISLNSLHINTELVVCEILRDDGQAAKAGEIGKVVLTDLHNYAMPFVRYFTGDVAVAGGTGCACGRGFPLIGEIQGRSIECLHTPSGKVLSPAILGHYLFVYHAQQKAVRHYQLIQESQDRVRLLVVPASGWNEDCRQHLHSTLASLLGGEFTTSVEAVSEIPLESSGKRSIIRVNAQASAA
jgi:phenylacetate-coenzyme A ligase PaaK-like adenylate-forming protein